MKRSAGLRRGRVTSSEYRSETAERDQHGGRGSPPRAGSVALAARPRLSRREVAEAVREVGPARFPEAIEGIESQRNGGGPGGL
jgi:hypothetical protein